MPGGLIFSLCIFFGCLGYLLGYWVRDAQARREALAKNLARRIAPNVVSMQRYKFERRGSSL